MNPSQWLHVFQQRVLWQVMRQAAALISCNLWNHDDAFNLLHHFIVFWCNSKHVACNLNSQITNANEFLKNIFRQDVCKSWFSDVIWIDINLFCPQVKGWSWDSSHSPICFWHKLLLFVLRSHLSNYLLSMNICRFNSLSLKLSSLFILFLNTFDFLLLNMNRCHLHS